MYNLKFVSFVRFLPIIVRLQKLGKSNHREVGKSNHSPVTKVRKLVANITLGNFSENLTRRNRMQGTAKQFSILHYLVLLNALTLRFGLGSRLGLELRFELELDLALSVG